MSELKYLDLHGARKIIESVTVPVVLDESVFSTEMLMEIIRIGAADRIVIKPSRVGGLIESRNMIVIAEAAGLPRRRPRRGARLRYRATSRRPPGPQHDKPNLSSGLEARENAFQCLHCFLFIQLL